MRDQQHWGQIRKIFEEVVDLPEATRETYLTSACRHNPGLRTDVERLLRLHAEAGDFLESPPTLVSEMLQASAGHVFQDNELVAGRFRIIQLLAFGGMGEVYEAEDEVLSGVRIALKTVRAPIAWEERFRNRFLSEVELSRKVTHPNVCRIYDLATHQFRSQDNSVAVVFLLTMELLKGPTLAESLHQSGPLNGESCRAFAGQVLDALNAAHSAGVLHGDLKPNNIMLVPEAAGSWRAVVTDFGLARGLAAWESEDIGLPSLEGGAPGYIAPEVLAGSKYSPAADLFSFGAVLYEALTGHRAFPQVQTLEEARHPIELPPAPSLTADNIEAYWDKLVMSCLQPNPEQRPRSAEEARRFLSQSKAVTRRQAGMLGLGLAVTTLAGSWLYRMGLWGSTVPTVAVLPFENGTGDPGSNYLVAGLTDEVRDALGRLPAVRVLARYSSTEINHAQLSLASSAQRLGAGYLIKGSVRHSDGRIRARVRLVAATSGLEIWQQEFDKSERDIAVARLEISAAIAAQLKLRLTAQSKASIDRGGTSDPLAFDLCLRAREKASSRTTKDLEAAYQLFGQALAADPSFALAWVGRAEALEILAGRETYPFIDSMTQARQMVVRALELQPELPEGLLELAMIRQRFEWNWAGADDGFRRALANNPNLSEGHRLYAGFLSNLGRPTEALAEIEAARLLDPLSLRVQQLHAVILLRSRRYQEAALEMDALLKTNPDYQSLYAYAGDAFGEAGDWQRALSLHREAVNRFGREAQFLYNLAFALAKTGAREEALQIAHELELRWPKQTFLPTYLAKVWIGLGDVDRAFQWLERAWMERDASLMVLNVEPWYDHLRSDSRFRDLARRVGLTG